MTIPTGPPAAPASKRALRVATTLVLMVAAVSITAETPTQAATATSNSTLDVAVSHACAVLVDGTVRCWGSNGLGQLGNGTTTNPPAPVAVLNVAGATSIATGSQHTCALLAGGTAKCWGDNHYGGLGIGGTLADPLKSPLPLPVTGLSGATAITAGDRHTCAIVANGAAKCWGQGFEGELGNGVLDSITPTPVAVVGLTGATAIVAGATHTCALLSNGTVKCWGWNTAGEVGTNGALYQLTPVAIPGLTNVTAITAGDAFTCARLSNGTVKCWGYNAYKQLGNGTDPSSSTPLTVLYFGTSALANVASISSGINHTCALLTSGTVRCWGANGNGQLGNGSTTIANRPVDVLGLNGLTPATTATAIAAGGYRTCALLGNGTVKCWGAGASSTPTSVVGLSAVKQPAGTPNVPSTPGRPAVTPGNRTATLTWTAPANGGAAITDYLVQYSSNSGTTWVTFADGVRATTGAKVTGLTNGTAYVFRVAAKNAKGVGLYSVKTGVVRPRTVPSAPPAPKAVAGVRKVTLTWTAPANGGAAIADYLVQYSSNSGTTWTTFADGVRATTGATVTGLTTGKAYVFRVAAKNIAGAGAYGLKSVATKPH